MFKTHTCFLDSHAPSAFFANEKKRIFLGFLLVPGVLPFSPVTHGSGHILLSQAVIHNSTNACPGAIKDVSSVLSYFFPQSQLLLQSNAYLILLWFIPT